MLKRKKKKKTNKQTNASRHLYKNTEHSFFFFFLTWTNKFLSSHFSSKFHSAWKFYLQQRGVCVCVRCWGNICLLRQNPYSEKKPLNFHRSDWLVQNNERQREETRESTVIRKKKKKEEQESFRYPFSDVTFGKLNYRSICHETFLINSKFLARSPSTFICIFTL